MQLFPIGTSRLHWPLEYVARARAAEPLFPGFGYVQSPGQVEAVLLLLTGADAQPTRPELTFRRDATPSNPFDARVWEAGPAAWTPRRILFDAADVVILEFSTPVEFRLDGHAVQGNPNHERDVPFAEIWRTGYYAVYAPELPVERVVADGPTIDATFARIARLLAGRTVLVSSHIFRRGDDHGRAAFAATVRDAAARHGWGFVDPVPFAERYGFRRMADGRTDIHHLSWKGTRAFAEALLTRAARAAGGSLAEDRLTALRRDRHEYAIDL